MLREPPSKSSQPVTQINNALASKNWVKVKSLASAFKGAKNQSVWVRTKLPALEAADPALYISQVDYFMQVFLNDSLIYRLGRGSSKNVFLGRNQNLIPLHFFNPGDELTLHIWAGRGSVENGRSVTLGSAVYLMKDIFRSDITNLIFAVLFFSSGIVVFLFMFLFRDRKLLFGLGIYLGLLGVFAFANSSFLQLVIKAPSFYFHAGYLSMIGSSVGGFYIIEQIVAGQYKKIVGITWKLLLLYLVFSTVYSLMTDSRFLDIIDYYLLLIIISVIFTFIYLLKSLKSSQYEVKIIIGGIAAIFLATLIEIALYLYYGFETRYGYGLKALYFGATIFVITIVWAAVDKYLRANKERAELQRAELEAIKNENRARGYFAAKLIESQENERNRIALGLHDSLGQKLLLIRNQLLSRLNNPEEDSSSQSLGSISDLAGESINEVRDIIYDLRPKYLDQLGLKIAIESIVEKAAGPAKINFHVSIDEICDTFSKRDEINFFRIVQESINNIIRHSGAEQASIDITVGTGLVTMKISDDGKGFDASVSSREIGFGITGMHERARMMGAKLDIISCPSGGTTVFLEYPKDHK